MNQRRRATMSKVASRSQNVDDPANFKQDMLFCPVCQVQPDGEAQQHVDIVIVHVESILIY